IGNLLYGTGLYNGSSVSATPVYNGKIGISSSTPGTSLAIGTTTTNFVNISATATSTFGHGVNLKTGCFAVGGTCLTNSTNYWTLSGSSLYNNSGTKVGIGTTSPWATLSVNPNGITGPAFVIGSSTATSFIVSNGGNVGIGTSSPETTLTVVGAICAARPAGTQTTACGTTQGEIYANSSSLTGGYDVAETYTTADSSVAAGDVVTIDPSRPVAIMKASSPSSTFLGVVSTHPGLTLGTQSTTTRAVALAGRVPVKVSLADGPIKIGDRLTVSTSSPGVAVKLVGPGTYFGQALEPYATSTKQGTVLAFINPGTYFGNLSLTGSTTASTTGAYDLTSFLGQIGATFTNSVLHVTQLAADTLYATQGFFDHLTAAALSIGTSSAPTGVTFYDTVTKQPYCFSIANGKPTTTPGACPATNATVNPFGSTTTTSTATTSGLTSTQPLAIKLNGANPTTLPIGGTYVEQGATVSGGSAGASYKIYMNGVATSSPWIDTSTATSYILTYTATDSIGDTASANRSVIVGNPNGTLSSTSGTSTTTASTATTTTASTDTTPPVVTLNGAAAMQITVGTTWVDPGATATDNVDGNLTSKIVETGKVGTSTPGIYTLTYSATDSAGNTGSASRVVTVVATTTTATTTTP
ncbi:MAG TPA: DUF5011 domain-containing protein, partial [Candidatus Paceibacterota bacterium]|nr:DUF5011 domain-containing protein [Candidatus Paceibacterota bacterium]